MNPSRRCAKVRVDTLLSFHQLLDYTAFDRICQAVFLLFVLIINYLAGYCTSGCILNKYPVASCHSQISKGK